MKASLLAFAVLATVAFAGESGLREAISTKLRVRTDEAPIDGVIDSSEKIDFQEESPVEFEFEQELDRCRNMDNGRFAKRKECLEFKESTERCHDLKTGRFVKSKFCIRFDHKALRCRSRITGQFVASRLCAKLEKSGNCRDRLTGLFLPREVCDMI